MTLSFKRLKREFLPFVEKPGRYIGGEIGLPILEDSPDLRVALAFPDTYELGMSYTGLRILYHSANQLPGVACERVFIPWFDAALRLKAKDIPLFTLETRTPLRQLDLIGINLQYELHTTNILGLLDLSGIPLRATQRTEEDPIILGGGPIACYPESLAPFFDAIAIGDGDDVFREIIEALKREKKRGANRQNRIRALGDIPGVYLPGYYEPQYSKGGEYKGLRSLDSELPNRICTRITQDLIPEYYPQNPIVPLIDITHNRLIVEIARGCTRGCRFCGTGMTKRPVRERTVSKIFKEVERGLKATGYSEVSLLSLSTADYSHLGQLLDTLQPLLDTRRVALSFPSLRPDMFTPQMADRAASESRTGLTFAPEAATERLRKVINKETSDEALLKAAHIASERGWKLLKLYFMIGLPTETDEDIFSMVDLIRESEGIVRSHGGHKINVSISPFSPKPHTPFEREGQLPSEEIRRRLSILKTGLRRNRLVKLEFRSPNVSLMETVIARGDRRAADAIQVRYEGGGLFDAWTDGFSFTGWNKAFAEAGLDPSEIASVIQPDSPLPWDHIDVGITSDFRQSEMSAASVPEFTPDCRQDGCNFCGLQEFENVPCPDVQRIPLEIPQNAIQVKQTEEFHRYRLSFCRDDSVRYLSHLDIIGILKRALNRLEEPLEYTQGYKPHLKTTSSPPLPLGMTSRLEYLDFGLGATWNTQLSERFQRAFPAGMRIVSVEIIPPGSNNIGALNVFLYEAKPDDGIVTPEFERSLTDLIANDEIIIERTGKRGTRSFDARPGIWRLEVKDHSILIGIKNTTGPTVRVDEILKYIATHGESKTPALHQEIAAFWEVERIGMWWESDGRHVSPSEQLKIAEINV
ncbi:B12-binding domain-containing radical SAM protein [candidate division LCP-89 bacterium B3_LCP]|uniref:B12-binding domain-containing radical SAM protein n=1 Tax=candidate division LCP-89 bacterium B3_LCP TaxID=2012998 RepID=A0A532URP3_UNCL8|nr:MAG: B12-binding domain-containing radical SAM protein [candidate division LCP-89 bacterium B3_LCP]